jgi:hypothetical protein
MWGRGHGFGGYGAGGKRKVGGREGGEGGKEEVKRSDE